MNDRKIFKCKTTTLVKLRILARKLDIDDLIGTTAVIFRKELISKDELISSFNKYPYDSDCTEFRQIALYNDVVDKFNEYTTACEVFYNRPMTKVKMLDKIITILYHKMIDNNQTPVETTLASSPAVAQTLQ